jgi:hypothetical protein
LDEVIVGRRSKLNDDIQVQLVKLISIGVTIETACANVGITDRTFYNWYRKGEAATRGKYFQFFQVITRARSQAHIAAVGAVATGLQKSQTTTETTETTTETRLRTVKHYNEAGKLSAAEDMPYEYTKTVRKRSLTVAPPDWRAGIEFLKRRDSDNWSDKVTITIEDLRQKAIADIHAGKLTYEALAAVDQDLADELFAGTGLPVQVGEGAKDRRAANG